MDPREEIANWTDESCEETRDFLVSCSDKGATLLPGEVEFLRAIEERLGA